MNTTTSKTNNILSFQRKVFFSAIIALFALTAVACKKEESVTPTPAINKNLPPATPNIKHVALNQLAAIGAAEGQNTTKIDIDNDGTVDFSATAQRTSNTLNVYIRGLNQNKVTSRTFAFNPFVSMLYEMPDSNIIADSLSAGNWINIASAYYQETQTNGSYQYSYLHFDTEILTGIRFISDGKTFYGWLRFKYTILSGTGSGAILNIIDTAYEQTEGFAIEVGRKN